MVGVVRAILCVLSYEYLRYVTCIQGSFIQGSFIQGSFIQGSLILL